MHPNALRGNTINHITRRNSLVDDPVSKHLNQGEGDGGREYYNNSGHINCNYDLKRATDKLDESHSQYAARYERISNLMTKNLLDEGPRVRSDKTRQWDEGILINSDQSNQCEEAVFKRNNQASQWREAAPVSPQLVIYTPKYYYNKKENPPQHIFSDFNRVSLQPQAINPPGDVFVEVPNTRYTHVGIYEERFYGIFLR